MEMKREGSTCCFDVQYLLLCGALSLDNMSLEMAESILNAWPTSTGILLHPQNSTADNLKFCDDFETVVTEQETLGDLAIIN